MVTIGFDTNPLVAGDANAAADVVTQHNRRSRQAGGRATRLRGQFSGPPWSGKRRLQRPLAPVLRTSVCRAINPVIAHLFHPEIAPAIPPAGDSPMTTTADLQIAPQERPSMPELRAADRGVADALEAVLSNNTRRVYGAQWRLFVEWCNGVGLVSLPAEPLTVARYLAVRANAGASIATLRLATSAIAKAHEWAKLESPCRDPGVRASLKGWGRRLSKPQRQSGALTADVLAVIRLTAVQPRKRGRGFETPEQAAERGKFDLALVAALSDARGLRRSEAASLTWGDVQRWDDGSGRITVIRSKTDVEAQGAVVAITPAAMKALDAIRPVGAGGEVKVFGLSESQISRRVKVAAKAAGLTDWEFFSGHSGRVGMARRMAQNGAPTHEIERQGRWKQGGGMVGRYTRGESAGSALRYL